MENTARHQVVMRVLQDLAELQTPKNQTDAEILEFRKANRERDSMYENFAAEIDIWARQALTSNGFGDY